MEPNTSSTEGVEASSLEPGTNCSPLDLVRSSAESVHQNSKHVTINPQAVKDAASKQGGQLPLVAWNTDGMHLDVRGPLTAQYLLVVDALNFCFWPDQKFDYEALARGLKASVEQDKSCLDAGRLATCTGPALRRLLQWPTELPEEDERARLVREIGVGLLQHFGGSAANLVQAASCSAAKLVDIITRHFGGFRDHAVYKGRQVFLYKRAQIFVGDIWGAFNGTGLGCFHDIMSLTMFADYLVPVVLRDWGILQYSSELAAQVDSLQEIPAGSEEEVEIRACTIIAVEKLRDELSALSGKQVMSLQIDWWLWKVGVDNAHEMKPHHRTRTIYY